MKNLLAVLALALVYGCATAPTGEALKAEVASYRLPHHPQSGMALVYVVRPSMLGTLVRFNVFLNDQEAASEVGYTRGNQYIYFSVPPGTHKIYSKAENWADVAVSVKAGDIVFVQQDPAIGLVLPRNSLSRIGDDEGKYHVKTLTVGTLLKPGGTTTAAAASAKPAAISSPFGTPLPDDLALMQPAPDVPSALAAFVGVWAGQWLNGPDHTLVVEKIEGRKARVVYSYGVVPGGGEAGFGRVDADLTESGALRASLRNGAVVVYRISPDGRSLAGEWLRQGRAFAGTFQRREIGGLAVKPFVAPPAAKQPTSLAAFSGSWVGRYKGGPSASLRVENVESRKAVLVYELYRSGRATRTSPERSSGRVQAIFADDGSLQATLNNGAKVTYRLAADGSLTGDYVRENIRYQGKFRPPSSASAAEAEEQE